MSKKRKETIFKGIAVMLTGICLIIIMIAYREDYGVLTDIVYILAGIVLIFSGIRVLQSERGPEREPEDAIFLQSKDGENLGVMGARLEKLRTDIARFLSPEGKIQNASIQEDVSQLFRNVLELQKKRMEKLGIGLDFHSEHRYYKSPTVRIIRYFDGKYEIQEVKEQIEAKRRYYVGDDTILKRKDSGIAHVTILGAKKKSGNEIICPGCGAGSTRENLLDGCDFCGTKFTIEDLGERVSSFAFRDDYEIAYEKYKEKRSTYAFWSFAAAFAVLFLLVALIMVVLMFDEETSGATGTGDGSFLEPVILILGFLAVGGTFSAFLSAGFAVLYGIFIFPLMETTASIKYNSKKKLEKLKNAEDRSKELEEVIRRNDPQFSIAGFHSNMQNKLSTIIFANTDEQINAFSEHDISSLRDELKNVFDYDLDEIGIDDFKIEDGMQKMDVHMRTTLFEWNGKKVRERKREFGMRILKNEACRTQAVCEPYVLRCRGCGNSISMMDGLRCTFCGKRPDIKEYDWSIDSVTMM